MPHDPRPTVLALRALKLGDFLVAVPALKGLKAAFPDHRLVFAAPGWLAPVVSLVDAVDELLAIPGLDDPLPPAARGAEVAVNLHGNGVESRGRLEALAPVRKIGHASPGWPGPDWAPDIHERHRWVRLLQWHGIDADAVDVGINVPACGRLFEGSTVLHVGAFYGCRQWPVDRFGHVARALAERGHDVLLTGGQGDVARAQEVARLAGVAPERVVAGRQRLDEFAATIAGARLVVSADTGAAHLASAYRIPSVVLFGPAPVTSWGPPPGPHIVLTDEALRRGNTFDDEPDPALLAVQPVDVLAAVDALDRRNGPSGLRGRIAGRHE